MSWRDRDPDPEFRSVFENVDDSNDAGDAVDVTPLPYSGRSVHCNECGYEGPPIAMLVTHHHGCLMSFANIIGFIARFTPVGIAFRINEEQEIEESCPNCGAEQRHLTHRRGAISREAWQVYNDAANRIVAQESRRRLIAILIVLAIILGVVGIIMAMILLFWEL